MVGSVFSVEGWVLELVSLELVSGIPGFKLWFVLVGVGVPVGGWETGVLVLVVWG